MGIDRLVMFLTDSTSKLIVGCLPPFLNRFVDTSGMKLTYRFVVDLKEVLLFPAMKPIEANVAAAASGTSGQ